MLRPAAPPGPNTKYEPTTHQNMANTSPKSDLKNAVSATDLLMNDNNIITADMINAKFLGDLDIAVPGDPATNSGTVFKYKRSVPMLNKHMIEIGDNLKYQMKRRRVRMIRATEEENLKLYQRLFQS